MKDTRPNLADAVAMRVSGEMEIIVLVYGMTPKTPVR